MTIHYEIPRAKRLYFNQWDLLVLIAFFAIITALSWGAEQMTVPYKIGQQMQVSLDPIHLPGYALRTVMRMFISLFFSLIFSFVFGTLAAKNKRAEQLIIPALDILQSVPVLGFLAITVTGFIWLFPNSTMGIECAAIFAIFTSQAWNMILSFYHSIRTVPYDWREAADMFQLSAWQRFWRIEVPFAMPALLWNTMMSMSGGWFFVVACEAIRVSNQNILLPGIGSYIQMAIDTANMRAVIYSIITMFMVILVYDQLLFRPLVTLSQRFNITESASNQQPSSWVYTLFRRTLLLRRLMNSIGRLASLFVNLPITPGKNKAQRIVKNIASLNDKLWLWVLIFVSTIATGVFFYYVSHHLGLKEIAYVLGLGFITASRVFILVSLCSLVWIPVGVWVGLRPKWTAVVQPLAQFLAAFPANLLFPIVVLAIVKYHLNVQIWTAPLMVLGTQWYILFNVIAAASALPRDIYLAAKNLGVKRWLWWKRVGLPAIFPYFVTGALAAAGGAWNASIVAEVVEWGNTTLSATGLGAYISKYTHSGDFPRTALGIGVMCVYVVIINRLMWQRLYHLAQRRYRLD